MKLVPENLNELNFERGRDPKKSMGVGSWSNLGKKAFGFLKDEFYKSLDKSGYSYEILEEGVYKEDMSFHIVAIVAIPKKGIGNMFKKKLERAQEFMRDLENIFEDSFFVEKLDDDIFDMNYEVLNCHATPLSAEACERHGVPWGSAVVEASIHLMKSD